MMTKATDPLPSRTELLAEVTRANRESSAAAVFFHSAVAEQVGLNATATKTLDLLSRLGPLTAGEIAQHTNLTTASVTALIDRLESRSFVRRVRDTTDRRRVIVELNEGQLAEFGQILGHYLQSFEGMLDDYSDAELALIAGYLRRAAQRAREAVASVADQADMRAAGAVEPGSA